MNEVRTQFIEAVLAQRVRHEERADIDEKNLLQNGVVSVGFVIRLLHRCTGWEYGTSRHHFLENVQCHTFTPHVEGETVVRKGALASRGSRLHQRAPVTKFLGREGDRSQAVCAHCRRLVVTRDEVRTYHVTASGLDVPGVLVGVCEDCGTIVTIPHQSTARLREARVPRKEEQLEARLPTHLEDVIYMVARYFSAPVQGFRPALLRFYLAEVAGDAEFAARVRALAESELAQAPARARVSLRLPAELLQQARETARQAGIAKDSSLLRGLLLAAKEDVLDGRHPERILRLSGAAQAEGAPRPQPEEE